MARQIRDVFAVLMKTSTGQKFMAEMGNPNAAPRPRKELQNLPHRTITTHRDSVATSGATVTHAGIEYLLCGQQIMESAHRFLAIEINQHLSWSRKASAVDPVTRMKTTGALQVLSQSLSVVVEPQHYIEQVKFDIATYRIFTSAAIQDGDLLGSYVVTRVVDLFGIKVAEAT